MDANKEISKLKIDSGEVYTLKDSLARTTKADIDSPSLTGTPTSPTPDETDNSTRIATTAFVKNKIDTFAPLIEKVVNDTENLNGYVDEQDKVYYDAIDSIETLRISSLFPVIQANNQGVAEAIGSLPEGQALKMEANQTVTENIVIDKSCYIDANGSTFEGIVSVPANKDIIIENATFAKPVVVA